MTTELPDGKILFRWTPKPEGRVHDFDDVPDEYAVVENPKAMSGIVVYAKYRGQWDANPPSMRPLVKHLLARISQMESYLARKGVPWESFVRAGYEPRRLGFKSDSKDLLSDLVDEEDVADV